VEDLMRTLILLPLAALLACTDTKTEQGISGSSGEDGTSGEDGVPGEDGEDGEPGADGEGGEDGSDGVPCWDLDGDGVPDPEEDTNGDGVVDVDDCRNDGSSGGDDTGSTGEGEVYLGDLVFYEEREALYFCENYDRVFGSLHANYHAESLTAFSCLVEVTQSLTIEGHEATSISLPNLVRVGQFFTLRSSPSAEETNFAALETVGSTMDVTGIGLEAVAPTLSFPSLHTINGNLNLDSIGAQTIDLSSIHYVQDLSIHDWPMLTNLDGMASLHTVNGYLAIERNDVLEDITSLMSVSSIGNDLRVRNNPLLPTSQADALAATIPDIGGEVFIDGNGPG